MKEVHIQPIWEEEEGPRLLDKMNGELRVKKLPPIRQRVSWSGDEEFEVTTYFSPDGQYRTVLQVIDAPLESKTRTRDDAIAQFHRVCDGLKIRPPILLPLDPDPIALNEVK